jgi:hypothetical protein
VRHTNFVLFPPAIAVPDEAGFTTIIISILFQSFILGQERPETWEYVTKYHFLGKYFSIFWQNITHFL